MARVAIIGSSALVLGLGCHAALASVYETKNAEGESLGNIEAAKPDRDYSPYVGRDYPDQVLFGDTHFCLFY